MPLIKRDFQPGRIIASGVRYFGKKIEQNFVPKDISKRRFCSNDYFVNQDHNSTLLPSSIQLFENIQFIFFQVKWHLGAGVEKTDILQRSEVWRQFPFHWNFIFHQFCLYFFPSSCLFYNVFLWEFQCSCF